MTPGLLGRGIMWRLRAVMAAGVATAVGACAHARAAARGAATAGTAGTASPLFTAVARTIVDSSKVVLFVSEPPTFPLQIDPRPLRTTPLGGVERSGSAFALAAGPAAFDTLPRGELPARIAALRRAGIPVGDITTLDKCPGAISPVEERKACPGHETAIAAFGVLDSAATRAVVQVLVLRASQAKSAVITPFEMERRQGRWVLGKFGEMVVVE